MFQNKHVSKTIDDTNQLISHALGRYKASSPQCDGTKVSAMEGQWEFFVSCAKDKAESHTQAARFWNRVDTFFGLSLIFLSASTTALALLDGVPKEVVAGIGAVSTMLAASASFLKAADRRQLHEKTSRGFRSLMVKMISCESEKDYEKYWADFNREIMDEPIMPKKFTKKFKMNFIMTPELREVVEEKELAIVQLENKKLQEQEAAEKAAEKLAEKQAEKEPEYSTSPRKDNWQSLIEIPEIASVSDKMFRDQLNRSAQANV
ncbi:uncharacterized protein LOC114521946 [Dendronephthya gigantea]|uniref:uncharacterized protein LOC114521946 n=1 Tax=Dendronephthya gigantea TaxID=151771 RepID=UPI0010691DFC|nr:uncharacterized protein LOC114521946 [Dendronephthya gigantea]